MYDPHTIADYIIHKYHNQKSMKYKWRGLSIFDLMKIMYLIQGYCLAKYKTPMFVENLQGSYSKLVYIETIHNDYRSNIINVEKLFFDEPTERLSKRAVEIIDHVFVKYVQSKKYGVIDDIIFDPDGAYFKSRADRWTFNLIKPEMLELQFAEIIRKEYELVKLTEGDKLKSRIEKMKLTFKKIWDNITKI